MTSTACLNGPNARVPFLAPSTCLCATSSRANSTTDCQAPGLVESWLAGFQGCADRVGHRV